MYLHAYNVHNIATKIALTHDSWLCRQRSFATSHTNSLIHYYTPQKFEFESVLKMYLHLLWFSYVLKPRN